jgi:hypothetical protein
MLCAAAAWGWLTYARLWVDCLDNVGCSASVTGIALLFFFGGAQKPRLKWSQQAKATAQRSAGTVEANLYFNIRVANGESSASRSGRFIEDCAC